MYFALFRATEDAINCLISAQQACEEKYMQSPSTEDVSFLLQWTKQTRGKTNVIKLRFFLYAKKNPPCLNWAGSFCVSGGWRKRASRDRICKIWLYWKNPVALCEIVLYNEREITKVRQG